MSEPLDEAVEALVASTGRERTQRARQLLTRQIPWTDWLDVLDPLHVSAPRRELEAAEALAREAAAGGSRLLAARFRLCAARALQRTGSPATAANALADVAPVLRAEGARDDALKAEILRVDALAHAGRLPQAFRLARRTRERLRPRRDARWAAALDVNEANALRLAGRIDEAAHRFDTAARRFERLGHEPTAAIARTNAAVARLDLGDGEGARRRLLRALTAFEAGSEQDMLLDVRENLACAEVLRGKLGQAIADLETLSREHEARGLTRRAAGCRLDMADALRRAGDRRSAWREANTAARELARVDARAEQVEALWQAALVAPDAEARRRTLADALAQAHDARPGVMLRCRLLLHDASLEAGGAPDAKLLGRLQAAAQRRGDPQLVAEVTLARAHAALQRGQPTLARRHLEHPALQRPGRPWLRAARDTAIATCESRTGLPGRAIARLRRVARFLDAVRAGLPGPWLRTTFVLDALDPHLARVELLLDRGRPADRMEAHAVLDALAARRFLERDAHGSRTPTDATRRRLEAVYDQLTRTAGDERGVAPAQRQALHAEAARLERAVAASWRRRERRVPSRRHVALADPPRPKAGPGACVVHLWTHRQRLWALHRVGGEIGTACDLGAVTALEAQVRKLWFHATRARRSPTAAGRALRGTLTALASHLLGPLPLAQDGRPVRWVLGPGVPEIPWEWLLVDGLPLCARHPMLRIPALQVGCPRRQRPTGRVSFAVGEADLPAVEAEAASVMPGARRLRGRRATREALREALCTARVVHVAGHGHAAESAPPLSGLRVHDGWFTAADVPKRVGSELVVLSACRTGVEAGAPGEAWGGLPTALLAAGARRVLWTADRVEDDAAQRFSVAYHEHGDGHPAELAFSGAAREVVETAGSVGPYLPFRLSGVA